MRDQSTVSLRAKCAGRFFPAIARSWCQRRLSFGGFPQNGLGAACYYAITDKYPATLTPRYVQLQQAPVSGILYSENTGPQVNDYCVNDASGISEKLSAACRRSLTWGGSWLLRSALIGITDMSNAQYLSTYGARRESICPVPQPISRM